MAAEPEVRRMKAVRFNEYGPATNLVVANVDRPEPKDGEVLVRVRAAGVNAIDWKFRAGYLQAYMPLELPHTPGLEFAGTVEKVGAGVSGFTAGNEVFGRGAGTYAEYAIARVQDEASASSRRRRCPSAGSRPGLACSTRRTSSRANACWCRAAPVESARLRCSSDTGRARM